MNFTEQELLEKTSRELYEIAKVLHVRNYTRLKKPDLIEELLKLGGKDANDQEGPAMSSMRPYDNHDKPEVVTEHLDIEQERVPEHVVSGAVVSSSSDRHGGEVPRTGGEEFTASGLCEILAEGYGFMRSNYFPSSSDVYISPPMIRRFGLRTGDWLEGIVHLPRGDKEKYSSLMRLRSINGIGIEGHVLARPQFESLTPIFPNKHLKLETPNCSMAVRLLELVAPIGKGQRGLIVSPPKAGKTTILKNIAQSIEYNHPEVTLMVLLIDERPEEVTDMKQSIRSEVISSTFDQPPENHIRVVELALERAKRLVEVKKDVVILMDGITRLTRAYNLISSSSGKTLSGGLDPTAIRGPKRVIGAARNMVEGGSLTIIATALIETGSRLDQVIYEEFKGTGNMELVLDRELAERRIFPAIDVRKSGTRREELLYTPEEYRKIWALRQFIGNEDPTESLEKLIAMLQRTANNREFLANIVAQDSAGR
ncbi:transcription termination factor Rho [Candidatus Cryosericum hinesii]|jgi:transcription termination factor Rho|uniref:Transcription termination factor Rho n=1 Tax=Candidatus Cryosericum hinesii TaxID=2290915 RepID=A0A398DSQ2_9BACT|nr:transcription termination factor Rho [Candidatus Cryosericum hinesii]RIE09470.1 transcription termination factor Rho [Candidatus Cryosericum hinesii]RIE13347.1 transcription termination factor Rho [Candidatus Cryosericum hinesii]RIE15127.1 transcription termination factor Rho [Candidatus Cryosericum hinesii]